VVRDGESCIAEMVGNAKLGHHLKATRQEVTGDQLPKLCGGGHGHKTLLGRCNEPHCRPGRPRRNPDLGIT
jgi:hypothetical protein